MISRQASAGLPIFVGSGWLCIVKRPCAMTLAAFLFAPNVMAEQYLVSLSRPISCKQVDISGDGMADQVNCGTGNINYIPCPDRIWWLLNEEVVLARNDQSLNPKATFVCVR